MKYEVTITAEVRKTYVIEGYYDQVEEVAEDLCERFVEELQSVPAIDVSIDEGDVHYDIERRS
jgi:hypothetical protein